jgi:uncharacterized SAM-binding protein YcdF (DUF218 family)
MLAIGVVIMVAWITRASWLPGLYTFLDVTTPPKQADFIVILGGGRDGGRAQMAAQLYQRGYADYIISSGCDEGQCMDRRILSQGGIPDDAILEIRDATNTWNEAQQVLALLRVKGAKSAIIVTDSFHSRRAQATYQHLKGDRPMEFVFVAAPTFFMPEGWWEQHSSSLIWDEYLKIAFYALRYGVAAW